MTKATRAGYTLEFKQEADRHAQLLEQRSVSGSRRQRKINLPWEALPNILCPATKTGIGIAGKRELAPQVNSNDICSVAKNVT